MVVQCLNFFNRYKFNLSVYKYMNYKIQLRKKKTYRVNKINEYSFLNVELIEILHTYNSEEKYVTTSSSSCQVFAF